MFSFRCVIQGSSDIYYRITIRDIEVVSEVSAKELPGRDHGGMEEKNK